MPRVEQLDLSTDADLKRWQGYVLARPDTQYGDLGPWRRLFAELYGLRSVNLACVVEQRTVGVASLYLLNSPFFGRLLVTSPYFGASGGLYADSPEAEAALLDAIAEIAVSLDVDFIELRLRRPLPPPYEGDQGQFAEFELPLAAAPESVWTDTLSSNVRQNIRKAQKAGLEFAVTTDADAAYDLLSTTIRDLGSPFHSRRLFELIRKHLPDEVRFSHVSLDGLPVAGGVLVRHRDRISTPYIGSLKAHRATRANYAQYWGIIEHCIVSGIRCLDLGRSPRGSSHARFKQKWGAVEVLPHYSHRCVSARREYRTVLEVSRLERFVSGAWKRVPVALTRRFGHLLVRHIP